MTTFATGRGPVTSWGVPRPPAQDGRGAPRFGSPAAWAVLWLTAAAGALLIAYAFSLAATDGTDVVHYAVFWAGMLVFFCPAVVVLTARRVDERVRLGWLLGYGLFSYLPKLLRNPGQPLFHDEIAHWRQTTDLAASGQLFQPNYLIGIVARFPGLHIVTASITDATGLTVWQSALVVLVAAHLLALFGACLLGEALFGSLRAGVLVALLYSLNSSFVYFDTEFAYESLAMPLFLWCLACLARAHRADGANERRQRAGWALGAVAAGAGAAATHHLTTVVLTALLVILAVVTVASAVRGAVPRATATLTALVALAVGGCGAAWLILVAPATFAYLSPYLGGGAGQLLHMFSGTGGTRSLFQASTEPVYERYAAFTVPLMSAALALVALLRRRRSPAAERRGEPLVRGLGLFGLLYFPSLPFILVEFGAEGARRSWGFSYLGLAVLVTPVLLAGLDRIAALRGRSWAAGGLVAVLIASDALVGNVAAGLDEEYRFPGPFVFGSDTRSVSAELVATSAWFKDHLGTRLHVVSDRYTGLILVRDAAAEPAAPSAGFATYDLYFDSAPPSAFLVRELDTSDYRYLVVDKRMATQLPEVGVFFEPDEPFAFGSTNPITPGNLTRYDTLPWTTKVYESDSYAIYRFDFSAIHSTVPGEAP
ncbi:putative membrane protein required for colicin V production [Kitasatospora sp. MAA4]|uniref:hypothetical protein n=1 Tax=Kitasatospora sp. MAA4 TaxID=3035093 RepID=UPI002473F295|nr:hypothetical protein [Kitasatospora sp. MAA4]MDH6132177.1 putative membrane protein required for colicin V production [Kitasatospora sp. MAA4]